MRSRADAMIARKLRTRSVLVILLFSALALVAALLPWRAGGAPPIGQQQATTAEATAGRAAAALAVSEPTPPVTVLPDRSPVSTPNVTPRVSLRGSVVRRGDEQAVAPCTVRAVVCEESEDFSPRGEIVTHECSTDAAGAFVLEFEVKAPLRGSLLVHAPGCQVLALPIAWLEPGRTVELGRLALVPLPPGAGDAFETLSPSRAVTESFIREMERRHSLSR